MPNRPLRRGENLLEIWERAKKASAKKSSASFTMNSKRKKSHSSGQQGDVDIAALVGPQKLGQWMGQIAQADSFGDYLDSRFAYLDDLHQGKLSNCSQKALIVL